MPTSTLIVAAPPLLAQARVAVHCTTCGALAETDTFGRQNVVGPMDEATLRRHAGCDLRDLYSQLSAAARELSAEWEA